MQVHAQASAVFDSGVEQNSIKLTMQRMQRQAVQTSRAKLNLAMVAKIKTLGSSIKKRVWRP